MALHVMRVIVIHAGIATGASSGLFGPLGDASTEVKIKITLIWLSVNKRG